MTRNQTCSDALWRLSWHKTNQKASFWGRWDEPFFPPPNFSLAPCSASGPPGALGLEGRAIGCFMFFQAVSKDLWRVFHLFKKTPVFSSSKEPLTAGYPHIPSGWAQGWIQLWRKGRQILMRQKLNWLPESIDRGQTCDSLLNTTKAFQIDFHRLVIFKNLPRPFSWKWSLCGALIHQKICWERKIPMPGPSQESPAVFGFLGFFKLRRTFDRRV